MAPQSRKPYFKVANRTKNAQSICKRYTKFLSVCQDPQVCSQVIKTAPESVIRRICDAALNAAEGEIPLSNKQKRLFKNHVKTFKILTSKTHPIKDKRHHLANQKGGAISILPILLSSVLGTIGSLLFKTKNG